MTIRSFPFWLTALMLGILLAGVFISAPNPEKVERSVVGVQAIPFSKPALIENGSGIVLNKEGVILTSLHIVSDLSASYRILTYDHKQYEAKVVTRDSFNDLALLKIVIPEGEMPELSPAPLGDSDILKIGEKVSALGYNLPLQAGTLTALSQGPLKNLIQTSAAIETGYSGGPLLNQKGAVIGIHEAFDPSGVSYAIPIGKAKKLEVAP